MTKKSTSYKSGLLSELIAAIFLTCKLYRVIDKRYKTKIGEIDIIALRGKTLIFIEVKKRGNRQELFECITDRQKQRISSTAELYLRNNPEFSAYKKRFDAILITSNLFPIHIKNAWDYFSK